METRDSRALVMDKAKTNIAARFEGQALLSFRGHHQLKQALFLFPLALLSSRHCGPLFAQSRISVVHYVVRGFDGIVAALAKDTG